MSRLGAECCKFVVNRLTVNEVQALDPTSQEMFENLNFVSLNFKPQNWTFLFFVEFDEAFEIRVL